MGFKISGVARNRDKISHSLNSQKHLMNEGNIAYLYPPNSGVRGIILEYGVGQKQAEEWWKIH